MFKMENKQVDLLFEKDGKIVKKLTLKNRLLDNYLDYVLFYMLPTDLGESLFPQFVGDYTKPNLKLFYSAFITTQANTLTDASTTMLYDTESSFKNVTEYLTDKTRVITSTFNFGGVFETGNELTYLGFGRGTYLDDYLMSYLDIRELDFIYRFFDALYISRTDEISTNENIKELYVNGVLQVTPDYRYLPTSDEVDFRTTALSKIYLCGEADGDDVCEEYSIYDLTITKTAAGQLEFSGFPNYYIENNILYPKTTLYPSSTLYPTQKYRAIKSVKFEYDGMLYNATYPTGQSFTTITYLNVPELDMDFSGKEFKILWKCDRG